MAVVSGDILEIGYNHPTIGTGVFLPKSAEDGTYDPGGFRTNDDANAVDGGGRAIQQMNRTRWSLETTISWDMNIVNELDVLRALASSPVDATFTITHINGAVHSALGKPVGDIQGNSNAGTISVKFSGGGLMKKISG